MIRQILKVLYINTLVCNQLLKKAVSDLKKK